VETLASEGRKEEKESPYRNYRGLGSTRLSRKRAKRAAEGSNLSWFSESN